MPERPQKVLIVDDDERQRRSIALSLRASHRVFVEAADADEALDLATRESPDIIVTDYHMPGVDGVELVRRLRANPFTAHMPVLMVSAEDELQERLRMIRAGVDDVVTKPYDPRELAARVDMVVARCERELSTDSLTRLPGNQPTRAEIERRLHAREPFALAYVDIDCFKPFVDRYGYERASEAISLTARVIEEAVQDAGRPSDFVGHIGGDDFALVLEVEQARAVCERTVALFAERIVDLYDPPDRDRGAILSHDRDGSQRAFAIMTLSAAIVHCAADSACSAGALAAFVARLKAEAKAIAGNAILDRALSEG